MRFLRHGGIYLVRWGFHSKTKIKTKSWVGAIPPPTVGPGPRQKNAPGGSRSFSSSTDEFRPAIPRSGWSPPEPVSASPARTAYHALPTWHLKTGTFYFAGKRKFLLCLDIGDFMVRGFRAGMAVHHPKSPGETDRPVEFTGEKSVISIDTPARGA